MKVQVTAPGMNTSPDTAAEGAAAQGSESQEYDLPEGSTVSELVSQLGLDAYMPEMVLINGEQRDLQAELRDGDAVALSGPMGGM